MQPHCPFVGNDLTRIAFTSNEKLNFWQQKKIGQCDVAKRGIVKAYEENLRLVLTAVEELLPIFQGKVVVTSDHGNMFGERSAPIPIREWGHPSGTYVPELVNVPWFTPTYDERKTIENSEKTVTPVADPPDDVRDRLRSLGYK
jgi:membrane-anchored protein YejM (alkaline phosphatase superfamily)